MHGVIRMDTSEEIALISFKKIPSSLSLLSDIFGEFADRGINIDMISQTAPTSGHVSISFSCLDSDMVGVLQISKLLQEKYPEIQPLVSSGNCKVQLFGEEMRITPGVFAKVMSTLRNTQVELQQITTSEVDISLLLGAVHLEEAAKALKAAFEL